MTGRDDASEVEEANAWWTTLQHQGVLISPLVLGEIFPDGPEPIPDREFTRLRKQYHRFRKDPDQLYEWLDTVLEDLLDHPKQRWAKEHQVPDAFKRDGLSPNRVLLIPDEAGESGNEAEEGETEEADEPPDRTRAQAMVWIDTDHVVDDEGEPGRIGVYSGRKDHARLVKLLRETDTPIGILTNGHQFRVVHATLDREAWTEWDVRAWFEGGEGRDALAGLAGLLGRDRFPPSLDADDNPLLATIEESRDRQADLSNVMGEQVREAVEILLRELDETLRQTDEETTREILAPLLELDASRRETLRARYQAAIRVVMRLVVALYAESRELLPNKNPIYLDSYSVEGLFRDLREARIEEGEEGLAKQFSAWPRLQALFRLIYQGSPHPDLNVTAYGGQLFRPPHEDYTPGFPGDASDAVYPAIAVLEDDQVRISDATILEVLEKLKVAQFKSGGAWRTGPVDFSDLRTEYIGMMYEGLLDYDLREATEDDGAIVFLNIGDQPALPFNVLDNLDDDGIEKMVDNLKGSKSKSEFLAEETVSREEAEEAAEEEEDDGVEIEDDSRFRSELHADVHAWARRVVDVTGLYMPHPNSVRAMDPTAVERAKDEAAEKLIDRIVPPGGTYLVSWSGTRKSTGTFYTPPGLAVPTVHRTLESLAYECEEDEETGLREKIRPKRPEEILDLKVCDPAMGSGTFLVAALEYLTDALKESFDEHVLPEVEEGQPIAAPLGETAKGLLTERILSIEKEADDERWEARLEGELKRLVVERCIYGVDINPLAVELAKLSLWVETMNPDLPFTFLDHKLKVGNSLIGAWLHEFMHYPVAAWNRDGANDERDQRIRDFRNGPMKEQMKAYIQRAQHDTTHMPVKDRIDPEAVIRRAREAFELIHEASLEKDKEHLYAEQVQGDQRLKDLKHLMDRWCAVWFWPMDEDDAPVLDPETFYDTDTIRDEETAPVVEKLASDKKLKFFHWEVEFPDVFAGEQWGFDGILGNPPWDKAKPNAIEFFTQYRAEFRTYNKRESKKVKEEIFSSRPGVEDEWLDYVDHFRGLSNYVSHTEDPWDVPLGHGKSSKEHAQDWATIRNKHTPDTRDGHAPPFRHQGAADLNTYKMFAEEFHYLTSPHGGRLGFICPSGIYSDYGTQDLRTLFLEESGWEWIYSFENAKGIFDIHRSFKFCANVLAKGATTDALKCRFMVHDLDAWNREVAPEHVIITRNQVKRFSPQTESVTEIESPESLDILEGIYRRSILISDLPFSYTREVNLSTDSELIWTRDWFISKDANLDANGVAWKEGTPIGLPLIEGRHLTHFDFMEKEHVSGSGRSAKWIESPWQNKKLVPHYLSHDDSWSDLPKSTWKKRVGVMRVTSSTNKRTIRGTIIPPFPTSDVISILVPDDGADDLLFYCAVLNSYVFDFAARYKLTGLDVARFVLMELPIPDELESEKKEEMGDLVDKLVHPLPSFSQDSDKVNIEYEEGDGPVEDPQERARIREELDKLVADAYGLTDEDMRWILRPDNDDPRNLWRDYKERLELLGGKGYWGTLPGYEDDTNGDVGQGPRQEARIRWATEDLAMERATEHFQGEGWDVEDVSGAESYDLRCTRGDEELRVEVKGTTTGGSSVILTKNEVEHAREQHPDMALFVLSGVEVVSRDEPVEVSGGEATVVQPWEPGEEKLEATEFRYSIDDEE